MKFNLAINSKVPMNQVGDLWENAHLLGKQIASLGHTLITPVEFTLSYQVAKGVTDKAGLSIGFSPANSLRHHAKELRLPTDAYDWIYFSNCKNNHLLNCVLQNSQALILVGGVWDNLSELSVALESFLVVGILLSENKISNNGILNYLKVLPLSKQKQIIVHQDPKILLSTIIQATNESYKDVDEKLFTKNNQQFMQILKGALKNNDA